MADVMTFPSTVDEFMDQYKIVDTEQVYTNGIELVPIFRMKQWFEERELDEHCTDCKEYDNEKHCCPRYNRVIREAMAVGKDNNVPAKHGRWIVANNGGTTRYYVCSECDGIGDISMMYCPSCGAKMGARYE